MCRHWVSPSPFPSSPTHTTKQLHIQSSQPQLSPVHYTDTCPTRNVVCPSGEWFENRSQLTPSIHLAWNPKHVIVQWVGIGTHTNCYLVLGYIVLEKENSSWSSKGLWQWCLICNINFFDGIHCLKCFFTQRFRSSIYSRLQVRVCR